MKSGSGDRFAGKLKGVFATIVALLLVVCPRAAAAKDLTIAIYAEGADAAAVRSALVGDVPEGTTVADAKTFSSALAQNGQKLPFGKNLDGDARDATVTHVRTALGASGLDAALIARVVKGKGKRTVKMLFVGAGRNDAVQEDEVVLGAKRSKEDAGKLKGFVDTALAGGSSTPAAAASAKPAAKEKEEKASEPASSPAAEAEGEKPAESAAPAPAESAGSAHPRGIVGKSIVEVEVGPEAAGRDFAYNQGIRGNLRPFQAFPVAMLKANAEAYPFADSDNFLRDLGIVGSYARTLFLSSTVQGQSTSLDTTESAFFVGLRYRIHPTSDPGFMIAVSDGYASQSVDFGGATPDVSKQIPSTSCTGNRLAVDLRYPIGPLSIRAGIGYRAIFNSGDFGGRFNGTSVGGIDAELGAAYELTRGWEVRVIGDYERYFYAFQPKPVDLNVAGGALDQFFGGRLAVAYIY